MKAFAGPHREVRVQRSVLVASLLRYFFILHQYSCPFFVGGRGDKTLVGSNPLLPGLNQLPPAVYAIGPTAIPKIRVPGYPGNKTTGYPGSKPGTRESHY